MKMTLQRFIFMSFVIFMLLSVENLALGNPKTKLTSLLHVTLCTIGTTGLAIMYVSKNVTPKHWTWLFMGFVVTVTMWQLLEKI